MQDSLRQAFHILTGQAVLPPKLAEGLDGLSDPTEIRHRILSNPGLYYLVPDLRLAYEIRALREARARGDIRLVVGAAGTTFPGWVPTNAELLDLLNPNQWLAWLEPDSVKVILAEHVWEHLDVEQGLTACKTCFRFLAPGGRLRLAVPDALFENTEYKEIAGVGGPHEHKVFYDHKTLPDVMRRAGFDVTLLEYWDEDGRFHVNPWDARDGHVGRSSKHDWRNRDGVLRFTSLIVDGIKPDPAAVAS